MQQRLGIFLTRHPVSALLPLFSSPSARTQPSWAMKRLTTLRDDRVGSRGGRGLEDFEALSTPALGRLTGPSQETEIISYFV